LNYLGSKFQNTGYEIMVLWSLEKIVAVWSRDTFTRHIKIQKDLEWLPLKRHISR